MINLKISDIDFARKTIHIRQSKYKKDRIVPLAESMAVGLKKYLAAENPHIWLFNGKDPDGRYSVKGLSWVIRENLKKTSITKEVNLHSLRHSYSIHLLEQGLNIVTLKELPGQAGITTTMIYLHVAQCPLIKPHSPLEVLIIRTQPAETNLQRFERLTGVDPCKCPVCKTGRMVVVRELPRIRAPDGWSKDQHAAPIF